MIEWILIRTDLRKSICDYFDQHFSRPSKIFCIMISTGYTGLPVLGFLDIWKRKVAKKNPQLC